jgi:hypothetical protein
MQINDKSLGEVFREMPWPFKIVVLAGVVFILYACYHTTVAYNQLKSVGKPKEAEQLKSRNFPGYDTGLFDPSLANSGKEVAMSYTTLSSRDGGTEGATAVRVMSTTAPCKLWLTVTETSAKPGNPVQEAGFVPSRDEMIGPDSVTPLGKGTWRIETSSLVYDPDDKGKEWKLYAYKYIWLDKDTGLNRAEIARLYSFIVHKHAPELAGPWSPEQWLFSAKPETPPQPYTGMVQSRLNALHPSLKDIYFYSRPSVIYADGVLFMTLSAFIRSRPTVDRIILIASLDHGKTWNYMGTPLSHDNVAQMEGYTTLGGGGLFKQGKKIYFWAVPGNEKLAGAGTMIMEFANVGKGELKTDAKGLPTVRKFIKLKTPAPGKEGGGYAAYDGACKSGIVVSEYSAISNERKIVPTSEKPFDE